MRWLSFGSPCSRFDDEQRPAAKLSETDARRPPRSKGPASCPKRSVSSRERIAQAVGRHARGVATHRQQRDEVAGLALQPGAPPCHGAPRPWCAPRTIASRRGPGPIPVGEQQQVGQLVVEPLPAERAEDRASRRRALPRRATSASSAIRCVLVGRVALDRTPHAAESASSPGRSSRGRRPAGRAHADLVEPGRAGVGGDDQVGIGKVGRRHRPDRRSPPATHDALARAGVTPFAGMIQIRFEGLRCFRTLSACALPCRFGLSRRA